MDSVTIHHLEMNSPGQLLAVTDSHDLQLQECEVRQYALNRFFYQWVGQEREKYKQYKWGIGKKSTRTPLVSYPKRY